MSVKHCRAEALTARLENREILKIVMLKHPEDQLVSAGLAQVTPREQARDADMANNTALAGADLHAKLEGIVGMIHLRIKRTALLNDKIQRVMSRVLAQREAGHCLGSSFGASILQ